MTVKSYFQSAGFDEKGEIINFREDVIKKDRFNRKLPRKRVIRWELRVNRCTITINNYVRSLTKVFLFYKTFPQGVFFVDMRGTKYVPIWMDNRPLFYWQFKGEMPMWKKRRMIGAELRRLSNSSCPCRIAPKAHHAEEFKNLHFCKIDEEKGKIEWDDGYCKECGADFKTEGLFCSAKCEEEYYRKSLTD
jgi:hypothetical protein